jgi:hypothetical protein
MMALKRPPHESKKAQGRNAKARKKPAVRAVRRTTLNQYFSAYPQLYENEKPQKKPQRPEWSRTNTLNIGNQSDPTSGPYRQLGRGGQQKHMLVAREAGTRTGAQDLSTVIDIVRFPQAPWHVGRDQAV